MSIAECELRHNPADRSGNYIIGPGRNPVCSACRSAPATAPAAGGGRGGIPPVIEPLELSGNPYGRLGTFLPDGAIDTARNAFFLPLNSANGRSCVTCHQPPSGMSVSLRNIRARFRNTGGTDPIFVPVDGANCPDAVPASYTSGAPYGGLEGKGLRSLRAAYSLLLNRGLIRIAMPWPPKGNSNPEFTLDLVRDAPGCNRSINFGLKTGIASAYRRPQMSAQMNFKTVRPKGTGPVLARSLMWDGREPSLEQQAINATLGHAQALKAPTSEQVAQIVEFENSVYSAQLKDRLAGRLDQAGGKGGPVNLSGQTISPSFSPPITFNEYDAWIPGAGKRRSIANGQRIFNQRTLLIVDVAGVNTVPGSTFFGACSTCHNVDHAGADVFPIRSGTSGSGAPPRLPAARRRRAICRSFA